MRRRALGWDGLAEAQGPSQAQLKGPQRVLASRPSPGAKGQSREASLQSNHLGGNLEDIPIACKAACQVWCLCLCLFPREFLFLHPRELAGCKLWPSHGIRINSWILAALGGDQLLLNCSLTKVPQATRHPKNKFCVPPIRPETQKTWGRLCPVALCCTEGLSALLEDLLSSHCRHNHSDHCGIEGPMIHSSLSNLKVNRGAKNKSERRSTVSDIEIKQCLPKPSFPLGF